MDGFALEGRPAQVVETLERRIEKMDDKLGKQLLKIERTAEKRFKQRFKRIKEDCIDLPFGGEECLVDEKEKLSIEQRMDRAFRVLDEGTEKLERDEQRALERQEEVALLAIDTLEAAPQPRNADPSDYAEARQCIRDAISNRQMAFEARLLESRERIETRLMELLEAEGSPAR